MSQFSFNLIPIVYYPEKVDLFSTNYDYVDLFSLELIRSDTVANNNNVVKGELYPLAIQVTPIAEEYSEFTIVEDECSVTIRNGRGNVITTTGTLSVDTTNKTIMFSWDTSDYPIDQYTIVFWITIQYNNVKYKIISDTINKSLRQESVLE